jgi:hypothetical protein
MDKVEPRVESLGLSKIFNPIADLAKQEVA